MVIKESGIIISGCPIVSSAYDQSKEAKTNLVIRSGLISGFMFFLENMFDRQPVEYIGSGKYIIAFKKDRIQSIENRMEIIVSYAILDKEKKHDKYISKRITPLLSKTLKRFIKENGGKNFSEVSQYAYFIEYIDKIFKNRSKTDDENVRFFLKSLSYHD